MEWNTKHANYLQVFQITWRTIEILAFVLSQPLFLFVALLIYNYENDFPGEIIKKIRNKVLIIYTKTWEQANTQNTQMFIDLTPCKPV